MSEVVEIEPEWIVPTAWRGHAPVAFWLVEHHRPRTIVELGVEYGFSYCCFCQQVRRLNLRTRCVGIDTWAGDEHVGFYSGVYEPLRRYHDERYSRFSRLLRSTFDDAVSIFKDRSIDLLHIDGRHRYEDARHDFETWLPKLSTRAIVLMHDTQVLTGDFGVWRFWGEIRRSYPSVEFTHDAGLGVLAVGRSVNPRLIEELRAAV